MLTTFRPRKQYHHSKTNGKPQNQTNEFTKTNVWHILFGKILAYIIFVVAFEIERTPVREHR